MKGTKEKQAVEKAALPLGALRDKNAGHGGSYTYNPATGERERAQQKTEMAAAQQEVGNE